MHRGSWPFGHQTPIGGQFVLRLPREWDSLFFPLGNRGLFESQCLSCGPLGTVMRDQIVVGHAPIIGMPILFVNRHPDTVYGQHLLMETLGTRLRKARKHRKHSQVALAKLAKIKQPSLSELETGETKEISGPTLIALSSALRVRPEWLMTGNGDMEPSVADVQMSPQELQLVRDFREAAPGWQLSLSLLAKLKTEVQREVSSSVNMLLAKVTADAVPDSKLGDQWTRPDK